MKINVTIRKAIETDIDQIYSIEQDSLALWKKEFFFDELKIPNSIFLTAEYNAEIIGFLIAWHIVDEIQINNIAIKKEYRKKGIGTSLIHYLINMLKPKGTKKILLETNESNQIALAFYKKLGFIEEGLRKKYYQKDGNNAILLGKNI